MVEREDKEIRRCLSSVAVFREEFRNRISLTVNNEEVFRLSTDPAVQLQRERDEKRK